MTFSDQREPSSPLFKKWKILKIKDIVNTQNCVLVHSFLKGKLPKSFENFFQKCSEIHINPTRLSSSESLYMKPFKSVKYGMNSITNLCIRSWNTLTEILDKPSTHPISKVKQVMLDHCIANYWYDILTISFKHLYLTHSSYKIHWSLPSPLPFILAFMFLFFSPNSRFLINSTQPQCMQKSLANQ